MGSREGEGLQRHLTREWEEALRRRQLGCECERVAHERSGRTRPVAGEAGVPQPALLGAGAGSADTELGGSDDKRSHSSH